MAMEPSPARGGKRTASKMRKGELRLKPAAVKSFNKETKAAAKAGKPGSAVKATSSGLKAGNKSVSAVKPSVAGAANKVKAQGSKMNITPSTTAAARAKARRKG